MIDSSKQMPDYPQEGSQIKQDGDLSSISKSSSIVFPPLYIKRNLMDRYLKGSQNKFTYFRILFIKMCNQEYLRLNSNPLQDALNCIYLQELVRIKMIEQLPPSDVNKDFLLKEALQYMEEYKILANIQNLEQFKNLDKCFDHYRSQAMEFITNYSLKVVRALQKGIKVFSRFIIDENQDFFYFCFQVCLNIRKIFSDESIFESVFGYKHSTTTPHSLALQIDNYNSNQYFDLGEAIRLCC